MTVKLTETRATWLGKIARGGFTRQAGGPTIKGRSRMPELAWLFIVENGLARVDCGDVTISDRGEAALEAHRLEGDGDEC